MCAKEEAGALVSFQELIVCALEAPDILQPHFGAVGYLGVCVPAHVDPLLLPRAVPLCFPLTVMTH